MRTAMTLVVAMLAAAAASAAADADTAKAVRMKTARQLKEILADLDIDVPAGADKEALRALAMEHDAITKYEAKHPEKKKKKPAPGTGGMPSGDAMGEMLFPMLDKDKDGKLSKEELMAMAQQAGGGGAKGKEETDNAFASMDGDGDGFVSKTEANAFFRSIAGMMGGGMGGGMPGGMGGGGMGGGMGGAKPTPKPQARPAASEEEELPSHDEL